MSKPNLRTSLNGSISSLFRRRSTVRTASSSRLELAPFKEVLPGCVSSFFYRRSVVGVTAVLALAITFSFSTFAMDEKEQGKQGFMKRGMSPEELKYNDLILELNAMEREIEKSEKEFQKQLKLKNSTEDPKVAKQAALKMSEIAMQRDSETDRYNEIRETLKYKFPDKGRAMIRRFAPKQRKSVEALEKPERLDEDLSEIKRLVDRKYKPLVEESLEKQKKEQAKTFIRPTAPPSDAPPPLKPIRLER